MISLDVDGVHTLVLGDVIDELDLGGVLAKRLMYGVLQGVVGGVVIGHGVRPHGVEASHAELCRRGVGCRDVSGFVYDDHDDAFITLGYIEWIGQGKKQCEAFPFALSATKTGQSDPNQATAASTLRSWAGVSLANALIAASTGSIGAFLALLA